MSKQNRLTVRGHAIGIVLSIGGIVVFLVDALVYGYAAFAPSNLNALTMWYTLLVIALAAIIGGVADIRLESVESKIDELTKRQNRRKRHFRR